VSKGAFESINEGWDGVIPDMRDEFIPPVV
jgi:hypothetical protein